ENRFREPEIAYHRLGPNNSSSQRAEIGKVPARCEASWSYEQVLWISRNRSAEVAREQLRQHSSFPEQSTLQPRDLAGTQPSTAEEMIPMWACWKSRWIPPLMTTQLL